MTRYSWISSLKKTVRQAIRPPLHSVDHKVQYSVLGTEYGGWPFIEGSLSADSLVYSFGVGEDLSFDRDLIDRTGVTVHAFDPTPKCMVWVETQTLPAQLHFHPWGIGASDGEVAFFPPENENHVSFSVAPQPSQSAATPHMATVLTLKTIREKLNHHTPECIKMDVEGFEYDIIPYMIDQHEIPQILLIEFHHGMYGFTDEDTLTAVNQLRTCGYKIFYISGAGREYGFVMPRSEA